MPKWSRDCCRSGEVAVEESATLVQRLALRARQEGAPMGTGPSWEPRGGRVEYGCSEGLPDRLSLESKTSRWTGT
jgi:hypothetical protein